MSAQWWYDIVLLDVLDYRSKIISGKLIGCEFARLRRDRRNTHIDERVSRVCQHYGSFTICKP